MSDLRSLWCIKERYTGRWCNSAKISQFGSFDVASIYVSQANAEKAIKEMNSSFDRGNIYIRIDDDHVAFIMPDHPRFKEYESAGCYVIANSPRPSYEAVECTLGN